MAAPAETSRAAARAAAAREAAEAFDDIDEEDDELIDQEEDGSDDLEDADEDEFQEQDDAAGDGSDAAASAGAAGLAAFYPRSRADSCGSSDSRDGTNGSAARPTRFAVRSGASEGGAHRPAGSASGGALSLLRSMGTAGTTAFGNADMERIRQSIMANRNKRQKGATRGVRARSPPEKTRSDHGAANAERWTPYCAADCSAGRRPCCRRTWKASWARPTWRL